MRRLFLLTMVIATIGGCSRNEYAKMSVYPLKKEVTVATGTASFFVVQVELPAHHHIYGNPKGPGTGKATEISVEAPQDILIGGPRFMRPKKFYFPGEREHTWGYENETKIFIPFTVAAGAAEGARTVVIVVDSLLCNDGETANAGPAACVRKIFRLDAAVRVSAAGSANTVWENGIAEEYKHSLPADLVEKTTGDTIDAGRADTGEVLPDEIRFSPRYFERPVTGILQAILLGILAGFILNFMPCVLPVVSLKIMGFVRHAGSDRKSLFVMGLLFTLGVLTCFGILATLAAFFGYRWGGLFQHRAFLIAMTGMVFALALSLIGVYTLPVPGFAGRAAMETGGPRADAYVKGFLATILATPCSGPLLGGTLAWALTQPAAVVVLIFMSVGFGMSLPYLTLTAFPRLLAFVPRPGEWTRTFEGIMAFLLFFTVIYLLGIFDPASLMPMILFLGFIALGLWLYGAHGGVHRTRLRRAVASVALVAVVAGGYAFSFHCLYREEDSHRTAPTQFSTRRLIENRDTGRVTVVDLTADWCPNCKLVEKAALQTDRVEELLASERVDFLRADITTKNPAAEDLMKRLGSQSIPLLAVFPAGDAFGRPIVLRDIYSEKDVIRAIETAREGSANAADKKYRFAVPESMLK